MKIKHMPLEVRDLLSNQRKEAKEQFEKRRSRREKEFGKTWDAPRSEKEHFLISEIVRQAVLPTYSNVPIIREESEFKELDFTDTDGNLIEMLSVRNTGFEIIVDIIAVDSPLTPDRIKIYEELEDTGRRVSVVETLGDIITFAETLYQQAEEYREWRHENGPWNDLNFSDYVYRAGIK